MNAIALLGSYLWRWFCAFAVFYSASHIVREDSLSDGEIIFWSVIGGYYLAMLVRCARKDARL